MGILPMWEPKTLLQEYLYIFHLYNCHLLDHSKNCDACINISFLYLTILLQALGEHTFDCSIGSTIFSYFYFSYYYEILSNKIVSASNLKINYIIMPHYRLIFFFNLLSLGKGNTTTYDNKRAINFKSHMYIWEIKTY